MWKSTVYLNDNDFLLSLYSLKNKKREEMSNQYEAQKVYFYYACVKYDVIGFIYPAMMNETNFYYKIHWRKGIQGLEYQFIFIFNKFLLNLYLLRKS